VQLVVEMWYAQRDLHSMNCYCHHEHYHHEHCQHFLRSQYEKHQDPALNLLPLPYPPTQKQAE
jgi:hypothetical protein